MEPEIKIVGEMDYIFREDRSVFDVNGLAPTLKTSNYERKILVVKEGKDDDGTVQGD